MNQFSISQLEKFSGIKAHTIRMWEQRYNALTPNRSEGNTRYYDNEQLRRLLNIVSLSNQVYKVSELCTMPDKQLFKLVEELKNEPQNETDEYFVSQLIAAGLNYDEFHFDKIFSHCLLRYGMKDTYLKVIYPVLVRTGIMWTCDGLAPANEHFISNLFRQKLLTAIDGLPPPKPGSESWLLFLPENEFHEIGLLLSHYLIRLSGKKVIYLGSNVPTQSLIQAVKEISCNNLLFFLIHRDSEKEMQQYLNGLCNRFKEKNIYVAGNQSLFNQLKKARNIFFLSSIDDLEQQLA
ncbi:MAG TPA: MerR family transcriptional regulator [Hanamia sp.]|nr:MerR family transcriptional regulator [Hanamia sp.]